MNNIIFLSIFLTLATIYLIVGIRSTTKIKTAVDYFVGGRTLGWLQISANLIATQLGGGLILGSSAAAYNDGFGGLLYAGGIALGFFVLSAGVAGKLQEMSALTVAEIFEVKYGSIKLRQFASVLSIGTSFGILCAQVVCVKALVASLGFPPWVAVLFWLLTTSYTILGGIKAITINDIIQLGVIFVTFFWTFFTFSTKNHLGFSDLLASYKAQTSESISLSKWLSIVLVPALFSLIEQDLAQRFFSAKSRKVATVSALVAGVVILLFGAIPVYFGMAAKVTHLPLAEGANPLVAILKENTSTVVFSFVVCSIFAAVISTADALINGIGANITQDFSGGNLSKSMNLKRSKLTSLWVGLGALFASYLIPQNVIDIMIASYELSICGLLVPLLYAYFQPRPKKNSAILSATLGSLSFLILSVSGGFPLKVVISLFISWIGYQLGVLRDTLSAQTASSRSVDSET
jgi:SSS family solute:Na+ symporter